MVIDVTRKNMPIDEFFHQIDLEVNESIHEFEYSLLLDKYNYLQENGVIMEEVEENNIAKSRIRKLINFIIQKVKDIWDWIKKKFRSIKSKVTGNRKKQVEQAEIETDKEAKEAIDQLNNEAKNPTENSSNKAQGIFNIFKEKQKKKAKDLDLDKDENSDSIVDQYIEDDGALKREKIASDIARKRISLNQLNEIINDQRVKDAFFGKDSDVDNLIRRLDFESIKNKDKYTDNIEKFTLASIAEVFNEKYLRELYRLSNNKLNKRK